MAMPVVVMAMSVAAWPLLLGCWLVPESGLDIYNLHPPKFDIDTKTDGFQDLVPEELYVWDNFSKRGIWCPNLPELLEPFLQDWKTYGFYNNIKPFPQPQRSFEVLICFDHFEEHEDWTAIRITYNCVKGVM